ncbi:hypothetical protein [Haloarchaeobius sp. DT45]
MEVVEPPGDENDLSLTFDPESADPETFIVTIGGIEGVEAGQPT